MVCVKGKKGKTNVVCDSITRWTIGISLPGLHHQILHPISSPLENDQKEKKTETYTL